MKKAAQYIKNGIKINSVKNRLIKLKLCGDWKQWGMLVCHALIIIGDLDPAASSGQ